MTQFNLSLDLRHEIIEQRIAELNQQGYAAELDLTIAQTLGNQVLVKQHQNTIDKIHASLEALAYEKENSN